MIQLKLHNTKIRLGFSFFAATALFMLTESGGFGLAALAACGLHELSHLAAMIFFSVPAEEITFYGAGIRISSGKINAAGKTARTVILFAGSAGNFIAGAALLLAGYGVAAIINFCTGLLNLFPIGEHDGAALMRMFVIKRCAPENVDKIMRAAGIISAALCAALIVILGGGISFSFMITALYIAAAMLVES